MAEFGGEAGGAGQGPRGSHHTQGIFTGRSTVK